VAAVGGGCILGWMPPDLDVANPTLGRPAGANVGPATYGVANRTLAARAEPSVGLVR